MQHVSRDPRIGTTLGTYRLETLIARGELGLLFGARNTQEPHTPHLVRVLAVVPIMDTNARTIYHDQFHIEASHLATLQHPYLLPLVGYGMADGMPYVVWPAVSTRSLSARLEASGPVDVLTVGRYLDQIAAALEYAHEHATVHGALTTDCLYLQSDGRVVVGDLGMRRLVELGAEAAQSRTPLGNPEACAPEQLLGGPIDPATDVYALGAVIYRLLTGGPVFRGRSMDEVAQQHLNSPIPPLSRVRPGLPPALDHLLAKAMAKDSAQRFLQPGALANAYHSIVAPTQTTRMPFVASGNPAAVRPRPATSVSGGSMAAGQWGHQPGKDSGALGAELGWGRVGVDSAPAPRAPHTVPRGASQRPPPPAAGAPFAFLSRARGRLGRNVLFGALVLVVVVGGIFGLTRLTKTFNPASGATGVALFMDSPQGPPGHSDGVKVIIHNLASPPSSEFYDAWLIDSASEHVTPLGTLFAQNGAYQLTDAGSGRGTSAGTNLLGMGDRIEITLEQGRVNLPVGQVVLSGVFPPQSFVHIRHLLVSFPTTPGQTALAVGVLQQTQLVDAQAKVLQSVAASQNQVAIQCAAQSLVDLLEGHQGAHFRPLGSGCDAQSIVATGDGFGLLGAGGYLAETAQHASNAAIAPDATSFIRTHAGHVEIAMTNIEGWLAQVEQDALALVANPANTSGVPQLVTNASHADNGVDTNGDESIDPVVGEAGAVTAYEHSQLMATLTLVAGA